MHKTYYVKPGVNIKKRLEIPCEIANFRQECCFRDIPTILGITNYVNSKEARIDTGGFIVGPVRPKG